jgi:hypothetical protein
MFIRLPRRNFQYVCMGKQKPFHQIGEGPIHKHLPMDLLEFLGRLARTSELPCYRDGDVSTPQRLVVFRRRGYAE